MRSDSIATLRGVQIMTDRGVPPGLALMLDSTRGLIGIIDLRRPKPDQVIPFSVADYVRIGTEFERDDPYAVHGSDAVERVEYATTYLRPSPPGARFSALFSSRFAASKAMCEFAERADAWSGL